jgi:hypothetical protein
VIVAYQPCKATVSQVGTVYQQHKCQQTQDGCPDLCPRQKFQNDFIRLLHQWRQNNDKLILFIDANKNTSNGMLHSALTGPGLLMREGVWTLHPDLPTTPSFMVGSCLCSVPIDAAYLSPDLPLHAGSWIVVKQSPGDHRSCILEIRWKSLVGEDRFKIARPETCHLTTAANQSMTKYDELLFSTQSPPKAVCYSSKVQGISHTSSTRNNGSHR